MFTRLIIFTLDLNCKTSSCNFSYTFCGWFWFDCPLYLISQDTILRTHLLCWWRSSKQERHDKSFVVVFLFGRCISNFIYSWERMWWSLPSHVEMYVNPLEWQQQMPILSFRKSLDPLECLGKERCSRQVYQWNCCCFSCLLLTFFQCLTKQEKEKKRRTGRQHEEVLFFTIQFLFLSLPETGSWWFLAFGWWCFRCPVSWTAVELFTISLLSLQHILSLQLVPGTQVLSFILVSLQVKNILPLLPFFSFGCHV